MNKQIKISVAGLILFGILTMFTDVITACSILFFLGVAIVVTYLVVTVVRAIIALGEMLKGDTE